MKNNETWDDRYPILNAPYLHYGLVTVTTSPWNAGVDGAEAVILMNVGAASVVDLPLASENKGKAYYVKKIDAAAGAVTIQAQVGDTIDGAASNNSIAAQYDCLLVVSDGGNGWWIIGEAGPSF
jgi:hypothetical protein